jgi:hypothetical protein
MIQKISLRLAAALLLLATGAVLSAQVQLPSQPPKQFGSSITPAFEGWFDNPDGTHSFLIGYYNRNTEAELDIPVGPNNHFEPTADMGQPTHFLTRRRFGMFVVTMPKTFGKNDKISWTLTANGVTTTIPFFMHTDYNLTPMKSSEESPNGKYNEPPVLRFSDSGPKIAGPAVSLQKAIDGGTATVGVAMPLNLLVDDDALYSSGGNGPMGGQRPPVSVTVSKYRGPGAVTLGTPRVAFTATRGGKPLEPYSGTAATTVKFTEPGEYLLHVTINDYSGLGGGGSGCCWTNALVKVNVKGGATGTTGN